jgi:hypothetical protein
MGENRGERTQELTDEQLAAKRRNAEWKSRQQKHEARLTQEELHGLESEENQKISSSTQASRLLEVRRRNASVKEELEWKRKEVEQREDECARKEAELQKKHNSVSTREERCNALIRENERRLAQAENRERDDCDSALAKADENEQKNAELFELQALRDSRSRQVERMKQHSSSLEEVVEASDVFGDIGELLQRHETLVSSNSDLQNRINSSTDELEMSRAELQRYTKEVQNDILMKTSKIAQMQKQLEKLRSDREEYEDKRKEAKSLVNEQTRRFGLARMAVENLYRRARETSLLVKGSQEHSCLLEKLEYIQSRILDLQHISSNVSHLQSTSRTATPSESSTTTRHQQPLQMQTQTQTQQKQQQLLRQHSLTRRRQVNMST